MATNPPSQNVLFLFRLHANFLRTNDQSVSECQRKRITLKLVRIREKSQRMRVNCFLCFQGFLAKSIFVEEEKAAEEEAADQSMRFQRSLIKVGQPFIRGCLNHLTTFIWMRLENMDDERRKN